MSERITMYGSPTCRDTKRSQRHLEELGVAYRYVDVDADSEASSRVEQVNDGRRRTPTIVLGGTLEDRAVEILSVPDDAELDAALARHGALPRD